MPKKRSHPVAAVKALPTLTASEVSERDVQSANNEWQKATEAASRDFGVGCEMAWKRYTFALAEDLKLTGPKTKTGGKEYSIKYDKERESALENYHRVCASAEAKLVKAIGGK